MSWEKMMVIVPSIGAGVGGTKIIERVIYRDASNTTKIPTSSNSALNIFDEWKSMSREDFERTFCIPHNVFLRSQNAAWRDFNLNCEREWQGVKEHIETVKTSRPSIYDYDDGVKIEGFEEACLKTLKKYGLEGTFGYQCKAEKTVTKEKFMSDCLKQTVGGTRENPKREQLTEQQCQQKLDKKLVYIHPEKYKLKGMDLT